MMSVTPGEPSTAQAVRTPASISESAADATRGTEAGAGLLMRAPRTAERCDCMASFGRQKADSRS